MRLIGHFENALTAERFSQWLQLQGIAHLVEPDEGERSALWIHAEEDVGRARELLTRFLRNPQAPLPRPSPPVNPLPPAPADAPGSRADRIRRPAPLANSGPWVTLALIGICLLVGILTGLGTRRAPVQLLQMSEVPYRLGAAWERFLPEVLAGQWWRLFTPAILHFSVAHILFNLWALWDLGNLVERRQGAGRMLLLVVGLAVISNLGQYLAQGPRFGGMSGAIYGLLGYAWMMGRHRPEAGVGLHPQAVFVMLVWFFICLSGALGVPVANWAHGVGLVAGALWGRIAAARAG